jgi:predicted CXXCH cytochrome family protein
MAYGRHDAVRRGGEAVVAIVLCATAAILVARSAYAGIAGSKHDLSANGGGMWGAPGESQVCVFCHVPHGADASKGALWNHQQTNTAYDLYSNPETLDAVIKPPQRESLVCLSCHDGVTALNALVNPSTPPPAMDPMGDQLGDIYYPGSPAGRGPNIGGMFPGGPGIGNLKDDHPVSFTFDNTVVALDGRLQVPPAGGPIRLWGPLRDHLECPSCHDPHSTLNPRFLVMSNVGSALCLACHIK